MDIRNWGWDQIMQLPDYLFGSRFIVSTLIRRGSIVTSWVVSRISLPERCVLWEFSLMIGGNGVNINSIRVHLGDVLPTTVAEMTSYEKLLPGYQVQLFAQDDFSWRNVGVMSLRRLKVPINSRGRQVIMEVEQDSVDGSTVQALYVFSGVPKEIPDWYSMNRG